MLQRSFDGGWVIRLETGESVIEKIVEFCEKEGIAAGSLSGIGAVTSASIMPSRAASMASRQNLMDASPATLLGPLIQGGTEYSS